MSVINLWNENMMTKTCAWLLDALWMKNSEIYQGGNGHNMPYNF